MDMVPAAGIYAFVTIAVLIIGTLQGSWLDTSNQRVLDFRKPKVLRVGAGMAGLLFLAMTIFFASSTSYLGVWLVWLWCVPMGFCITILLCFLAGPQDVTVDIDSGMCRETKGWIFLPKRHTFPLTQASCICICSGGQTYYVYLMIGGGTERWFLLARPERSDDATSFAQEIADMLHLPVKETTFRNLRDLS